MGLFDSIVDTLKQGLSGDGSLSDITFINAYPGMKKTTPLNSIYATLEFSGIDISNGFFNDYLGLNLGNEIYGKEAIMTIGLKIYTPQSIGGERCAEIFSRICSSLFFAGNSYNIRSLNCSGIEYNPKISAFVLGSSIELSMFIARDKDESNISNIIVKGEF